MLHKFAIYMVWRAKIIFIFHHLYSGFCWKAANIWLAMSSLTVDMASWPTKRFGATMPAATSSHTSSGINFKYGIFIQVVLLQKSINWVIYADEVIDNCTSHWDHHLFLHRKQQSLLKNFKPLLQKSEGPLHTCS